MAAPASPAPASKRIDLAAIALLAAAMTGCGHESAKQQIERQAKDNPKYEVKGVVPFSGKVTVDGQPPAKDLRLFVILNDPKHLEENAHRRAPKLSAICNDDGKFAFSTYDKDDGVPPGDYVVTFVLLHAPSAAAAGRGARMRQGTGSRHFSEPDELKNLYNDPDQNQKVTEFNLKLEPPGKPANNFDLTVAGKEPAQPGPNAVTQIISPR
jgi:hypothetical protein